jgi:hypothetical protein
VQKLFDSGSVAGGAVIASGILSGPAEGSSPDLQVFVDNTAGTAQRSLTLETIADSAGTDVVDSVVLRVVPFGSTLSGSSYAPGRVRGYIGPNPPAGASGTFLVYDETGADNTILTSPVIPTHDFEWVIARRTNAVGAGTSTMVLIGDNGNGTPNSNLHIVTAAATSWLAMGPGLAAASPVMNITLGHLPIPMRDSAQFVANAAGGGTTTRLSVLARGRVPGTFSVQMAIPAYWRITLAAAGTGAARVVVYG